MKVFIRSTANGNEYWDATKKRTVLFPKVIEVRSEEQPEEVITLDNMDADMLRQYADANGIKVPANIKKVETIRKHIENALSK